MRILMRLGVGIGAGTLSMALLLGVLEDEVNWRRMLFIGAFCGLGTAATLEAMEAMKRRRTLTPIEAVTLQLSRTDLSATQAVALTEQLATLQAQQGGEITGATHTTHHAPRA